MKRRRGEIETMYPEYMNDTQENSELNYMNLEGVRGMGDKWNPTRKTKRLIIQKVIDLEKYMAELIVTGNNETTNEDLLCKY